ncbi:hypothetical protein H4219_002815 [Mycoemilia scoparia]|uniref:Uncharacterized protein n=1 Tax=Mycoemilia scoparia TaxID=417184 RepID=A0A9W8A4J6_9FUNG|nr:hypothetical protein H4219_002815 [Mycoemilia scoparia]
MYGSQVLDNNKAQNPSDQIQQQQRLMMLQRQLMSMMSAGNSGNSNSNNISNKQQATGAIPNNNIANTDSQLALLRNAYLNQLFSSTSQNSGATLARNASTSTKSPSVASTSSQTSSNSNTNNTANSNNPINTQFQQQQHQFMVNSNLAADNSSNEQQQRQHYLQFISNFSAANGGVNGQQHGLYRRHSTPVATAANTSGTTSASLGPGGLDQTASTSSFMSPMGSVDPVIPRRASSNFVPRRNISNSSNGNTTSAISLGGGIATSSLSENNSNNNDGNVAFPASKRHKSVTPNNTAGSAAASSTGAAGGGGGGIFGAAAAGPINSVSNTSATGNISNCSLFLANCAGEPSKTLLASMVDFDKLIQNPFLINSICLEDLSAAFGKPTGDSGNADSDRDSRNGRNGLNEGSPIKKIKSEFDDKPPLSSSSSTPDKKARSLVNDNTNNSSSATAEGAVISKKSAKNPCRFPSANPIVSALQRQIGLLSQGVVLVRQQQQQQQRQSSSTPVPLVVPSQNNSNGQFQRFINSSSGGTELLRRASGTPLSNATSSTTPTPSSLVPGVVGGIKRKDR